MTKRLLLIGSFLSAATLCAQDELDDSFWQLVEERIEFLSEEQIGSNSDYTAQFEYLAQAFLSPIDLNHTDSRELHQLALLNQTQIIELLAHREKHGKLLTFEELLSIRSFDRFTILLIRPFCTVKSRQLYPDPSFRTLLTEGKSTLFLRHSRVIELAEGFKESENGYLGGPDKLYSRYRFQYHRRLSIGFSAEKDPGEAFFSKEQKQGFDFYSAHLFIQEWQGFNKLALGDFQAQFGQGLTYWSGVGFGAGLGVAGLKRVGIGLMPYTSIQENSFLRGLGLERSFGKFRLTAFVSSLMIGGRLIEEEGKTLMTGFPGNGLHRTAAERERKARIQEQQAGLHLRYTKSKTEIGLTAASRRYPYSPARSTQVYQRFGRAEKVQMNLGVDYSKYLSNLLIFGETAYSLGHGIATLNGLLWMADRDFRLGLLHRHYQKDYIPIQSNALGSNSNNSNERGLFLHLETNLFRGLSFNLNYNLYRFPWLRFQVDAPSSGLEKLAELRYSGSKQIELYFRFRERKRQKNARLEKDGVEKIKEEISQNYRLHLTYQINERFSWQSRIEWRRYSLQALNSRGLIFFQDLNFKSKHAPLSFSIRLALFDCPDFQSRIYAYERDVLYAFSIPAYQGIGSRYYLLMRWKISNALDLWLRYDRTSYLDREILGSGRDEILGNHKSQLKTQLRLRF